MNTQKCAFIMSPALSTLCQHIVPRQMLPAIYLLLQLLLTGSGSEAKRQLCAQFQRRGSRQSTTDIKGAKSETKG